jgi:hypothetical protein
MFFEKALQFSYEPVISAELWRSRSIGREILNFMRAPELESHDQEQQPRLLCGSMADIRLLRDSIIDTVRFVLSQ